MDEDSILDFSPFPSIGQKRPAEVTPSADNKKRAVTENNVLPVVLDSALSPVPVMSKEAAARAIKATVLPKAPKKQSQYVRFKSVMLKDAKFRGDRKTVIDITAIAKTGWNWVKNAKVEPAGESQPLGSSSIPSGINAKASENESTVERYIRLKGLMIAEETKEAADYEQKLAQFKSNYLDAATAYVWWKSQELTKWNITTVDKDVKGVYSKMMKAWPTELPLKFQEAHQRASFKLHQMKKEAAVEALVQKLRNASDDVLLQHAQEHFDLSVQVEELNGIKKKAGALEAEKEKEEQKQLSSAHRIKPDICRELKKQMIYTDSSLKYNPKKISYKRGGVSLKVFAAAFEVPEGTKTFTFGGGDVGSKSLRYSYLECHDVVVKLVGEELTASTSYMIDR